MRAKLTMLALSAALGVLSQGGAALAADPVKGEELAAMWCKSCHVITIDQERASADAPTYPWLAENRTPEALELFLAQPHSTMPTGALTPGEIRDIVAYIMTFKQ